MSTGKFTKNSIFFGSRRILLLIFACQTAFMLAGLNKEHAFALGFISHHATHKLPGKCHAKIFKDCMHATASGRSRAGYHNRVKVIGKVHRMLSGAKHKLASLHGKVPKRVTTSKSISTSQLETVVSNLQSTTIAPGVIYRKSHAGLRINVLEIDTVRAPVFIKPLVAAPGTARLQTVNSYAAGNHALAAINANYFKSNGVPLGTLMIDGDWVSGPIYDRVALGISRSGFPRIDKVNLGGMLYTSNLDAPKIWVNNVNQMHRTGSHVIAYTRRWGNSVSLPFDGTLVAIDAQGKVLDVATRQLTIPYGGVVLTDSKNTLLSQLCRGDVTYLRWQVTPPDWDDVAEAVSGGPILIKDGNYCIDLPDEKFRGSWASSSIKARTACGITADNRLILVTVEGTHTIFDLAHILHDLGAVEAMNLDGGGSTTMVVHNATVNMENKSNQRRVAAALGIFQMTGEQKYIYDHPCHYVPRQSLVDLLDNSCKLPNLSSIDRQEEGLTQEMINSVLKIAPKITAENKPGLQIMPPLGINKAL